MALGRISYTDLTPEQRREGAARARAQIKALLANPALPPEQRDELRRRLERLCLWEAGKLHEPAQRIEVTETVTVKEEV